MSARLESMLRPPIAFADGGASGVERDNTIEAFALALRVGANGLESTVWRTADDVAVLAAQPSVRQGLRRTSVRSLDVSDLPEHIPSLDDVLAIAGDSSELSLRVGEPEVIDTALAAARVHEEASGVAVRQRLWFRWHDWEDLARWRERWPDVRLIDDTRLALMESGPERRAASLASAGIDGVRLPYADWTGGLATLFHRFEVLAFSCDAEHDRMLDDLLRMGVDAVSSRHADRLIDAFTRAGLY